MRYKKHIFICTNTRKEGVKCCGGENGLELIRHLKKRWSDSKSSDKIRIQSSGCLDICEQGPAMVIYPEGTFYGQLDLQKADIIFEKHIKNNEVVAELTIKNL